MSCSDAPTNPHASEPEHHVLSLRQLERSIQQASLQPTPVQSMDTQTETFLTNVRSYRLATLVYEDDALQKKALSVVPLHQLQEQAEQTMKNDDQCTSKDRALTKHLLHWFKNQFFTWFDAPECWSCSAGTMRMVAMCQPSEEEIKYKASRTEQYVCRTCRAATRFPRYNDPAKLLQTRRGRCGEWANAFTLIARAVGLKVRAVHDWTDHVWTEVYCRDHEGGAWIHADSCEDVMDEPLLYEKGWGKKLNYCIATGVDGVIDVTRRYTQNFEELMSRRTLANETLLQQGLKRLNDEALKELEFEQRVAALSRYHEELDKLAENIGERANEDGEELLGRQSGNADWVRSRGEDGGN